MTDIVAGARAPNREAVSLSTASPTARVIRIGAICLIGTTFGTVMLPLGAATLLLVPMTHDLGWSRTEFLFGGTLMLWSSAASMPLAGWASDRLGVRWVIATGTALIAAGVLGLSLQNGSLSVYYMLAAFIGATGGTAICYAKVIAAIFGRHRGKALAIFGVESMLAIALIPLITNWILAGHGWRSVYFTFACILATVAVFAALMLEEPARTARKAADTTECDPMPSGHTLREALRDRNFWILVTAMLAALMPAAGFTQNLVPALLDKGFNQATAAGITSFFLMTGLLGSVLAGYLADRINSVKVALPFFLTSAAAVVLLSLVTATRGGYPLLLVAIALHGCALFAYRPLGTYFLSRFFGLRCFNALNGVYTAILAVAMGFGPLLLGRIYDTIGSYQGAYILMIAGALGAAIIIFGSGRYNYSANILATVTTD